MCEAECLPRVPPLRDAAFLERMERRARLESVAAQITELAAHLNAATYRWLMLVAEFDDGEGWSDGLLCSCAHWLNYTCGIDLGAAREKVRVAHALTRLPLVSAAMAEGKVSYSKVRAITRVANEDNESYLLDIAYHGTAHHVERLVSAWRRTLEVQELGREAAQRAGRYLRYRHDETGSLLIEASLPADAGALVLKALDLAVREAEATPVQDVAAETLGARDSFAARRADALGRVAEGFIAAGARERVGDMHQIIIHVDAVTLASAEPGRCEIEQGPSIAAATAQRLACDASVIQVVENEGGEPLSIGRKSRTIPPAIRRALAIRDRGCRFPGCTHTRYVDGHHIQHWANGGETRLSNLITLCDYHHRAVHELGVEIRTLDDGFIQFVRADGRPYGAPRSACFDRHPWPARVQAARTVNGEISTSCSANVDSGSNPNATVSTADVSTAHAKSHVASTQIARDNHELGLRINSRTLPLWKGEAMDYSMALEHLWCQHLKRRARNVAAETSTAPGH